MTTFIGGKQPISNCLYCKSYFIIVVCVFIVLLIGCNKSKLTDYNSSIPENIIISKYFHCYGGLEGADAGIDWEALHDIGNNSILRECLNGTDFKTLQGLGIDDLQARLNTLRQGKLIEEFNGKYQLTFPKIIGAKRVYIRKIASETARELLPLGKKMIQQITPILEDREDMLFHALWSGILDGGTAWRSARAKMKAQVTEGDTSSYNKVWLIYPEHPFTCGTNTYGFSYGTLRITWSDYLFDLIKPIFYQHKIDPTDALKELSESAAKGNAVASGNVREVLKMCGLVDIEGNPTIYTIEGNSSNIESYKLFAEMGQQFGENLMDAVDIHKAARNLEITPGMAFLIIYHETCYQLLGELTASKVLNTPKIITEKSDVSELQRLISFVIEDAN